MAGRLADRVAIPGGSTQVISGSTGVGTHYRGVSYGGTKNSGVGTEEGLDELMSYTEIKSINIVMG
jgi:acyl-CoA reductase-like NAD-dependent aldehyde dehydrogenase